MRFLFVAILAPAISLACVSDRTSPEARHSGEGAQEYLCFAEASAEKVAEKANAAAQRGWQLITAAGSESPIWCMRRARRDD